MCVTEKEKVTVSATFLVLPLLSTISIGKEKTKAAHSDQSKFLQPPNGISIVAIALMCSYFFEDASVSSGIACCLASEPMHVAGTGMANPLTHNHE